MKVQNKSTIIRILYIFSLTLAATLLLSVFHPSGLELILENGQPPGLPKGQKGDVLFVDITKVFDAIEHGEGILIDIRDEAEYKKIHPRNSVNIPYHNFEAAFYEFSDGLPSDTGFYILCDGVLCGMSARAARNILRAGFENVTVLKQSFEDYRKMGLPCEADPGEGYAKMGYSFLICLYNPIIDRNIHRYNQ